MYPEFNFTDKEKEKILKWKNSLPENPDRKFKYSFVENGNVDEDDYKQYNVYLSTSLTPTESILIAKNVSLF